MKLKIISYSATKGGAAKAAINFLNLIVGHPNYVTSFLSVSGKLENDVFIKASKFSVFWHFVKMLISRSLTFFNRNNDVVKYSLNIFSSNFVLKELDLYSEKKEVIHINWINNDTLSLVDIKRIFKINSKKVLLTLHDEWFYCATEHYADLNSKSYINGYGKNDGLINSIIFNLKQKIDFDSVVISVPSQWMYDRAKQSYLLRNADIHVLPNAIDTEIYDYSASVRSKRFEKLGVNSDSFIIGFGAVSGGANPLKGFDLLIESLKLLLESTNVINHIVLLTFGTDKIDKRVESFGCKVINLGFIPDAAEMAMVYNLIDVMIVPSRAESFGQVAAESLACQTPVIAFNHSGIQDIILHQRSGLLAEPFSIVSLTDNIKFMMNMSDQERMDYGICGRQHVVSKFGKDVILKKYVQLLDYVKGATND